MLRHLKRPTPDKSAYRHVGFARFPVSGIPVYQDVAKTAAITVVFVLGGLRGPSRRRGYRQRI